LPYAGGNFSPREAQETIWRPPVAMDANVLDADWKERAVQAVLGAQPRPHSPRLDVGCTHFSILTLRRLNDLPVIRTCTEHSVLSLGT